MNIFNNNNKNYLNQEMADSKIESDYIKKYMSLRKKKDANKKEKIIFEKKLYEKNFSILKNSLKEKNHNIKDKNVILTIGTYTKEKRNILENIDEKINYDEQIKNILYDDNPVAWNAFSEFINFDINQDLLFNKEEDINIKYAFKKILKSIYKIKENSKISSIIVRLKSSDLLKGKLTEEEHTLKIQEIFNNLYKTFKIINEIFEYKIPVYLLISELEDIFGFDSFTNLLNEKEKTQILGLSYNGEINLPYDSNISKEEFKNFKTKIKSFIAYKSSDSYTTSDYKNSLLFINELDSLLNSIQIICDKFFPKKEVENTSIYRGVYFCGTENKNNNYTEKIETEDSNIHNENFNTPKKTYFIKELIQEKIKPEFKISIPSDNLLKKNKTHSIISSFILLTIIILIPIFTYKLYSSLNNSSEKISYIFNKLSPHVEKKEKEKRSNIELSQISLTQLIDIFESYDIESKNKISSKYSPISMLSGFDGEIKIFLENMINIFEVRPTYLMIINKINKISQEEAERGKEKSVEDAYERINKFVLDLNEIEKISKDYNQFGQELKVDQLNIMVQKLMGIDLSDFFPKTDISIKNLYKNKNFTKVDFEEYQNQMTTTFEFLLSQLIQAIESEYIVKDFSNKINDYLDNPEKKNSYGNPYSYMNEIYSNLNTVYRKSQFFTSTRKIVAMDGNEINLDKVVFLVKNSSFLNTKTVESIDIKIKEAINKRNLNLLEYKSILLGPMFVKESDKESDIRMAPAYIALKNALEELESLPLIKPMQESINSKETPSLNPDFDWQKTDISILTSNINTYEKYINDRLTAYPDALKPIIKDLLVSGMSKILIKNLNNKDHQVLNNEVQINEATAAKFSRRKDEIIKILSFFFENDKYGISQPLRQATLNAANAYLGFYKNKLQTMVHYEPLKNNFDWWDGTTPPGLEAYQVFETRDLLDYVSRQNQTLEQILYNEVSPILDIVNYIHKNQDVTVHSNSVFWKLIFEEINNKDKNSSFQNLNNFILTTLTSINSENCLAQIEIPHPEKIKNDYFINQKKGIISSIGKQCKKIAENKITQKFNNISTTFNQKLAGKFPFVEDWDADNSEDLDLSTIQEFMSQFDDLIKDENFLKFMNDNSSAEWKSASDFIKKINNVKIFFSSLNIDEKNTSGGSKIALIDFLTYKNQEKNTNGLLERSAITRNKIISNLLNEKEIEWQPSEPFTFSFHWAKDNPIYIVNNVSLKKNKIIEDLNNNDKTISFTVNNQWSLIYLIRKFSIKKSKYFYSQTLSFKVPLKVVKETKDKKEEKKEANILLKLKFFENDKKNTILLPVFPSHAEIISINKQ